MGCGGSTAHHSPMASVQSRLHRSSPWGRACSGAGAQRRGRRPIDAAATQAQVSGPTTEKAASSLPCPPPATRTWAVQTGSSVLPPPPRAEARRRQWRHSPATLQPLAGTQTVLPWKTQCAPCAVVESARATHATVRRHALNFGACACVARTFLALMSTPRLIRSFAATTLSF